MAAEASEEVIRVAETLRMLQEHLQCVICLETLQDPVNTHCGHTFCQACINRIVKGKNALCPLCNSRLNRRGIVENEKIRNVVQAVHVMISNAQKDISELGYENVLLCEKDNTSLTRKTLSPIWHSTVNLPSTTAEPKPASKRSSKVESWLMDMHTPSSTQESVQSGQVDNSTNEDSDSEMVSVSQINPDHPNYHVSAPSKSLSAHIEDDGDAEQFRSSKQANKKTTRKSLTSKKAAPLKVKSKQQSLKGFMTLTTTPIKSGSSSINVDCGVTVPDPVIVVMDLEKENTTSILPTRSPGWSRVQKMKKDFHQPSRVLQSTNPEGNHSPVPSIEDPGSSDEQPCLNLSLDSPVLRKKAKMNEIVNSLASEIETIEKSEACVEKIADKNPIQAAKDSRKNLKLTSKVQNCDQSKAHPLQRSLVQFLKLGPMVSKKIPSVPIYLRGSLEHLHCFNVRNSYRSFLDAQTQTDSGNSLYPQKAAESPLQVFKSPHLRRSVGANSECDMDAETVLFTQPVTSTVNRNRKDDSPFSDKVSTHFDSEIIDNTVGRNQKADSPLPDKELTPYGTEIIDRTFLEDKEQSQKSDSLICPQNAELLPDKICITFIEGKGSQSQHSQLSSRGIENSPKKTKDFETSPVNIPQVDLDDSCSSVENRPKHSRIFRNLSDSSDSDEVSKKPIKKRKTNPVQVLSDSEDSCTNDPDISIVDTSKIMANIAAQLDDEERKQSSEWSDQDKKTRTEAIDQVSGNFKRCDAHLDELSDTSKTQNDSDDDLEIINPTPQKQNSFTSRQISQSDDIVPCSQPSVAYLVTPDALLQNPHVEAPTNSSCVLQENELFSPPRFDQEKLFEKSTNLKKDSCSKVHEAEASEPVPFPETVDAPAIPKSLPSAKLLFVCSSLPANALAQVEKLASFVGAEFSSKFTSETSHLIVRVDENNKADKTLKFLCAVAAGKWVVSFTWVQKCLEAQKLLPEEPYEALDTTGEPGPQRSRKARLMGKRLFEGFEFCCVGDFPDLSKAQMQGLLIDSGASIVEKPTDFSFQDHIIPVSLVQWDESKEAEYSSWLDTYSTPLVQHEWVLDCIGKFCVTSFSSMLLCDVMDEYLTSMGIPAYLFEPTESEQ